MNSANSCVWSYLQAICHKIANSGWIMRENCQVISFSNTMWIKGMNDPSRSCSQYAGLAFCSINVGIVFYFFGCSWAISFEHVKAQWSKFLGHLFSANVVFLFIFASNCYRWVGLMVIEQRSFGLYILMKMCMRPDCLRD